MKRRKRTAKASVNGHANGISHVPEETSADELASATATSAEDKKGELIKPKINWEIPRKTLHSSIGMCLICDF
jgi:hypothetical protein